MLNFRNLNFDEKLLCIINPSLWQDSDTIEANPVALQRWKTAALVPYPDHQNQPFLVISTKNSHNTGTPSANNWNRDYNYSLNKSLANKWTYLWCSSSHTDKWLPMHLLHKSEMYRRWQTSPQKTTTDKCWKKEEKISATCDSVHLI